MKASELRTGNYYNQFGNILQVTGNTICDLEKAPQSQLWCKPIPLTEEWLLKFGLYKDWIPSINSPWIFNIHDDSKSNFAFKRGGIKIEYVHQLQNLYFALTGEELLISN